MVSITDTESGLLEKLKRSGVTTAYARLPLGLSATAFTYANPGIGCRDTCAADVLRGGGIERSNVAIVA